MIIRVTQEHIARGERQDCEKCPIALAAKDCWPNSGQVMAELQLELFDYNGQEYYTYALPEVALEFIKNFDKGKEVKPFEFEMPDKAAPDNWDDDY